MTIKVSLAGVTGWTGKLVAESVIAAPDMELVSCVSRSAQGKTLSSLGLASDLVVSGSVAEALKTRSDVFIDFTSADAVKEHVLHAIGQGVSTIVGSSGLSATDFDEIQKLALDKGVGVIACGNFSITAALAKHFSLLAANICRVGKSSIMLAPPRLTRRAAQCESWPNVWKRCVKINWLGQCQRL
jgi:4-hydroxy-tetrahydrodipicolinate reductase